MKCCVALTATFLLLSVSIVSAKHQKKNSLYSYDATFTPELPTGGHTYSGVGVGNPSPGTGLVFITQRGNTMVEPVLVYNKSDGKLLHSWGYEAVGVAPGVGGKPPTWGAHGITVEECQWSCGEEPYPNLRIWIEDFTNHTVTSYTAVGKKILQLGSNGVAGNGTKPVQFDSVADAVAVASLDVTGASDLYVSDGDGGHANRVLKIVMDHQKATVAWATDHIFNNPHSIAHHASSDILVVADRENLHLKLLQATDGKELGVWDCGLNFGSKGRPFGVRTLKWRHLDLLMVAIMDNPQDGLNMRIAILDASNLNAKAGASSACSVREELTWNLNVPAMYSGPHLLGLDHATGDIYAALVSDYPESTVLRFKLHDAPEGERD